MRAVITRIRSKLRFAKRWYYSFFDWRFPQFEIDWPLMQKAAAEFRLDSTTDALRQACQAIVYQKGENAAYFANMLRYINADRNLPGNPFFIYPPNVAVIDFLLKHGDRRSAILEYGYGLGNLMVYLRALGFVKTFGYDDYSQIRHQTTAAFLRKFNASDAVLSKEEALSFRANIVVLIGYFWNRLDAAIREKEIQDPGVEFLLIEYSYAPRFIPGFTIAGIYKNVLVVFKRNS